MESEKEMLNSVQSEHPKYWIPCVWYINLLRKADAENKISNAPGMKTLLDELNLFREKCDSLYSYDWIEVPIVYTQVVTLAVYSYFVASLFSHQFLAEDSEFKYYHVDLFIPFTCVLELVFYIGWLKVAEKIMDPFGDDEHDFDMNVIVDRNWQISYLTVDTMYETSRPLTKDVHYRKGTSFPQGLPHTKASMNMPISKGSSPWLGSANTMSLTDRDMEMVGGDDDDVGCCSCFQTPTARIDSSTADNTPLTTFPNGRANSVNDRRPTSSTNHGSRIAREPSYEDTGNRDSRRGPRTNPDRSQSVHRPQNVLT